MKFTFGESVKLAAKGFKPGDIAELSSLDENKFSKDDILSLINNGYSKSDVKKLVDTFSSEETNEDPDDTHTDDTDNHSSKTVSKTSKAEADEDDPEDEADKIDYKALYEKEKKLRENLQHKNAAAHRETSSDDTRTPEQIAIEIAQSII